MRKSAQSMHGVTLLEIMLVLAIAAMIIVMSVRYYQSANNSQQANNTLAQIQAIAAAADSLAQGSGSYSAVDNAALTPLLPQNMGLTTTWGSAITVTGAATSYDVSIASVPAGVCTIVQANLAANAHFKVTSTTCAGGNFTYTYYANPPASTSSSSTSSGGT